jgi:hypothetical protein
MQVKVYWKSGAVECYTTNSDGFRAVNAACFFIDHEGVHLSNRSLDDTLAEAKGRDGLPPLNTVIVPYDVLDEVEVIYLDGEQVDW